MNANSSGFFLKPRRGTVLRVLIIVRISTVHQDARSLDDQAALCQNYVRERYPGPAIDFVIIQGQGSGEILDRKDLADAEAAVDSSNYDLVVVEDLGRICRRNRAIDFCELCEDAGTRLIAINDAIDTVRDDWRMSAFFATLKHESSNKDTSRRIRRSHRNRFAQGGVVQTFPYGYTKPKGAKSDSDVIKDPDAESVYDEVFRRLESGAPFSEVADWLNERKVPTGPWMRTTLWDGRSVARTVRNPILKGDRRRNERMSQRVNKTGRRRSVKAPPEEPLCRHAPHLAFIESCRYDRVIAQLAVRHADCARGRKAETPDGRAGVPKKRTVWPGQHVCCGVCGRMFYWGGHGQAGHLMCSGARDYACWNAATFHGSLAGRRLVEAVLSRAEGLPKFDEVFLAKVEKTARSHRSARADTLCRLDRDLAIVEREVSHLIDGYRQMGHSTALAEALAEAEARKARLNLERLNLLARPDETPQLPSVDELKRIAREQVGRLAFDDPAFARLMHRIVPRIEVFPHQLLDGGPVVLRARLSADLAPLLGAAGDSLGDMVARTETVDLFESPQRAVYRERIVALRKEGMTERKAACHLELTVTAAQRAMALHRKMQTAGVTDPYQPLFAPPDGEGRFRRHKHERYQFEPLDGYPTWLNSGTV